MPENNRSFFLKALESEYSVTISALSRYFAIPEAEVRLERDPDLFGDVTEVLLIDVERNCKICLFERENARDSWKVYPV